MHLKSKEIEIIQDYVSENGLLLPEVQEDVVDHICCLVEEKIGNGEDFEKALLIAQQYISENDLREIQDDTIYFLTIKKRIIMIKTIFISAYASVAFLVLGVFFLVFGHILLLPDIIGFAIILSSVITFCFVFLPTLFLQKYNRVIKNIKT